METEYEVHYDDFTPLALESGEFEPAVNGEPLLRRGTKFPRREMAEYFAMGYHQGFQDGDDPMDLQ